MKRPIMINTLALGVIALLAMVLPVAPAQAQAPRAQTVTSVSADMNPAPSGAAVTLTANVAPLAGTQAVATGTVEFFSVLNSIGKATLVNTNGTASASITVQFVTGLYPISVR